jgi:transcriptional regulator with XRE-family HTH domain
MNYETSEISERLKAHRVNRGLSQRQLSELSGVPQAQISKLENGQADVRISTLVSIARALKLELELVPRKNLPAVQSLVRGGYRDTVSAKYTLNSNSLSALQSAIDSSLKSAITEISDNRSSQKRSAYSLMDEDDE